MSDNWKRFFAGVATALATVGGILLGIFLAGRGRRTGTPAEIAADAERQIEEKRNEIKADSDQALADRFNSLAKKEKKS